MDWSLSFEPLFELWILAIVGALCLGLLAIMFGLGTRGLVLRAATMAILILALLNPIIRGETRKSFNDILVVIADNSPSQKIGSRSAQTAKAVSALKKQLAPFKNTTVRWIRTNPAPSTANTGTRLFETLNDALADVPPERLAGIILVTDGQVHDVPENLGSLTLNAPIHTLLTGDQDKGDRRIIIERSPKFGIVGEEQSIKFKVEDLPSAAQSSKGETSPRTPVSVTIRRDGKLVNRFRVLTSESIEIPLAIEHAGPIISEITVSPGRNEISLRNNRAVFTTQGVRDRLRVLLVSGEPHSGQRTWRNLLKADPAVDLVHFTILRPPEKQDGTPIKELSLIAFPTRELFSLKLNEFDLIIFDRYRRRGVLPLIYLANVADYVENGGAILAAAGPSFATPLSLYRTPLSAILPAAPTGEVTEQPFRPQITDIGRRHPVTRSLPGAQDKKPTWGRWFRLIDVEPTEGNIVMSGPDNKPLMVLKRQGKGRVAQLLSDQAWLWARGFDGGGPQVELLRRMAHWLMKEPDLEEEALVATQIGNDLKIQRFSMKETTPTISITDPEGRQTSLTLSKIKPGSWSGIIKDATPGIYQLVDGELSQPAVFGILDQKEFEDIRPSADLLQPVNEATGGKAFWLGKDISLPAIRNIDAGRRMSGSGWIGIQKNNAYTILSLKDVPLLSGLLALAAVLGLMSMLWYREGH
jgi:hypothetical protein